MISQHPNGTFFLFLIGNGQPKGPVKQWNSTPPQLYPFPKGSPEPPSATTHAAESLEGPWRAAEGVPALNNPCPFFFENGTTLLFDRTSVISAPTLDGPWSSHRPTVVEAGKMKPEDPGVYRDKRGGFHMLFNANSGHGNCAAGVPCGGHAWSTDGLVIRPPPTALTRCSAPPPRRRGRSHIFPLLGRLCGPPPAPRRRARGLMPPQVRFADNSTRVFDYVERPQVLQDSDGNPLTLFAGHGYRGIGTLSINFCAQGDADRDCVTSVGPS